MVIVFGVALAVILVVAAVVALLGQTPEPPPDCQPGTDCGGPPPPAEVSSIALPSDPTPVSRPPRRPPATVGIRAGTPWLSPELGYEFEYSDWWALDSSNGRSADLVYQGRRATPSPHRRRRSRHPRRDPQAYADRWLDQLKKFAPDLKADASEKNAILGPEIGFVDGIGRHLRRIVDQPAIGDDAGRDRHGRGAATGGRPRRSS